MYDLVAKISNETNQGLKAHPATCSATVATWGVI